jgi:hypothetical protein
MFKVLGDLISEKLRSSHQKERDSGPIKKRNKMENQKWGDEVTK